MWREGQVKEKQQEEPSHNPAKQKQGPLMLQQGGKYVGMEVGSYAVPRIVEVGYCESCRQV